MSSSKNSKSATGAAQTQATCAAFKLASFSASCSSTQATPDEPAAAGIAMDQLSAEFTKQRTPLREGVSLLIKEAVKPIQSSLDSFQSTVNSSELPFLNGVHCQ